MSDIGEGQVGIRNVDEVQINPATTEKQDSIITAIQANVLSAYASAGQDTSSEPMYVGGVKSDGSWYIKKIYIATPFTTTYVNGASDFATAWTARASQTYVDFNSLTW